VLCEARRDLKSTMRIADGPHAPCKSMPVGKKEKAGMQRGATSAPRSTFLRNSFRFRSLEPAVKHDVKRALSGIDQLCAPTVSRTVMSIAWRGMSGWSAFRPSTMAGKPAGRSVHPGTRARVSRPGWMSAARRATRSGPRRYVY
jgi:hypothetical protein